MKKGCACLSDWWIKLTQAAHAGTCSQCSEAMPDQKKPNQPVLLVLCANDTNVQHFVELDIHNRCIGAFRVEYFRKKRNLLYPMVVLVNTPFEVLLQKVLAHIPVQSRCGGCGAYEQERVRFDHCSGCKSVTYCDAECQLKDWPEHRVFCEKRQASMATIEFEAPTKEDFTIDVCCLNQKQATQIRREGSNLCSNPTCENVVAYPCVCTRYTIPCKVPEKSGFKVHSIGTYFCNIVCQKDCSVIK